MILKINEESHQNIYMVTQQISLKSLLHKQLGYINNIKNLIFYKYKYGQKHGFCNPPNPRPPPPPQKCFPDHPSRKIVESLRKTM